MRISTSEDDSRGHDGPESPSSNGGGRFFRRFLPNPPGGEGKGVDLRNTWQVVAGSILVPLGVVLILFSWYGAAHTSYVQQQIPYLVSGSFAGLGCMVLGGLFYWAHWLYRLYDQADHHHDEQLEAMKQTLRAIAEGVSAGSGNGWAAVPSGVGGPGGYEARPEVSSSAGPPAQPSSSSPFESPASEGATWGPAAAGLSSGASPISATYVVTASGSVYHLPSCPVIAHHTEGLRVLGAGAVLAMEACGICLPTG